MADEIGGETPTDASIAASERPRFRLQHLFVLTAVMAVMLGISAPLHNNRFDNRVSGTLQFTTTGWGIVHSMLSAAAITAAGYGLYWRRQGQPFLDQPGHWLLVEMAIVASAGMVQQFGMRFLMPFGDGNAQAASGPPSVAIWFLIAFGVLSMTFLVVCIGLNIYFARKQSEPRWRTVFYLKAVTPLLWALGACILLIWLLRVIVLDRRDRLPRDAAHQCGVALQLAQALMTLVMTIGMVGYLFYQLR